MEIFKEIMVELIKSREIDVLALKKERSEFIQDTSGGFQLNEMLLQLLEEEEAAGKRGVRVLFIERVMNEETVTFDGVRDEQGSMKAIRCSNITFRAE